MKKWYVLYVKSGEEMAILNKLKDFEAFVPLHEVVLRKNGRHIEEKQVLFPGYIFIKLEYFTECYYRLINMPYVYKFLQGEIREEEIQRLIEISKRNYISTVIFSKDGKLVALDGELKGLEDKIVKVDRRKQKAKVKMQLGFQERDIYFFYKIANDV